MGELSAGTSVGRESTLEPDAADLYDEEYYQHHLGPEAYDRSNPAVVEFFCLIADQLIRSLQPKTVLDAGCAMGFLVEALWDRGVKAEGVDISPYAISKVRKDVQPFCRVGSIVEPLGGRYDLVTCIEVLEHIPPEQTRAAIENLCGITDRILFSSSPYDLLEPTHINVRQPISWLELFHSAGFTPDLMYDAGFVTPQAMLLRRASKPMDWEVLRLFSEMGRYKYAVAEKESSIQRLSASVQQLQQKCSAAEQRVSEVQAAAQGSLEGLRQENERLRSENGGLTAQLRELSDKLGTHMAAGTSLEAAQQENARLAAQVLEFSGKLSARAEAQAAIESSLAAAREEIRAQVQEHTRILTELNASKEQHAAMAGRMAAMGTQLDDCVREYQILRARYDRRQEEAGAEAVALKIQLETLAQQLQSVVGQAVSDRARFESAGEVQQRLIATMQETLETTRTSGEERVRRLETNVEDLAERSARINGTLEAVSAERDLLRAEAREAELRWAQAAGISQQVLIHEHGIKEVAGQLQGLQEHGKALREDVNALALRIDHFTGCSEKLQVEVADTRAQLRDILHSRVWKTLTWLGGMVLRVRLRSGQ